MTLVPVGRVRSPSTDPARAPKQGDEDAPDAWLVFEPAYAPALAELRAGEEILVLTWLDRGDRATLRAHPRDDPDPPLRGVFSTRSADRPNPVGLHRVRILTIESPTRVQVRGRETVDGTPVIDVKPVPDRILER